MQGGYCLPDQIECLRNSVSRLNGCLRKLCCVNERAVSGPTFCHNELFLTNMVARGESVAGQSNRSPKWSDFAKLRASRATGRSWRARKNFPRSQAGWNAVGNRSRAWGDASARVLCQRSSTNECFVGSRGSGRVFRRARSRSGLAQCPWERT